MQHGAKRATPPARNAARMEPVVSRSPMSDPARFEWATRGSVRQKPGQFAAGEPALAEECAVNQDEGAHGCAVASHELLAGGVADVERADVDRVTVVDQLLQHLVRIGAVVARGGLDHGDLDGPVRRAGTRGQGCLLVVHRMLMSIGDELRAHP